LLADAGFIERYSMLDYIRLSVSIDYIIANSYKQ